LDEKDEPGNDEAGTVFSWIINIRVLCGCGVGARFSLSAIPHKIIININQVPSLVLLLSYYGTVTRALCAIEDLHRPVVDIDCCRLCCTSKAGPFLFSPSIYIFKPADQQQKEEGNKNVFDSFHLFLFPFISLYNNLIRRIFTSRKENRTCLRLFFYRNKRNKIT
jgi:hypothetical protein